MHGNYYVVQVISTAPWRLLVSFSLPSSDQVESHLRQAYSQASQTTQLAGINPQNTYLAD